MTTVVGYNGKMWSDSQETRGYMMDNQGCQKIHEVGGCLVGTSGNAIGASKFVEWFGKQLDFELAKEDFPYVLISPPEDIVDEDFHCLVIYPDKTMYEYFGCKNVYKVTTPYTALGSGSIYALSALDAGVSPEVAMEVAIKRDVFSGGKVQSCSVSETVELSEDDLLDMDKEQLIQFIKTGEIEPTKECIMDDNIITTPIPYPLSFNNELGDHLNITAKGIINFGQGYFTGFKDTLDNYSYSNIWWLKTYADMLGVKYAHNISREKLTIKLDIKIDELVASLNK